MSARREPLIVFSHLRWDFVWQRPQHLVSRLAEGRRTWFVEEPRILPGATPGLRCVEAGPVTRVWLEIPGDERHCGFGDPAAEAYLRHLLPVLGNTQEAVVWLYTPMALRLATPLRPRLLVYDVMDDLASFKGAPPGLAELQGQALEQADVVFAGGRSLYESVSERRSKPTFLFASGVEPEHYQKARTLRTERPRPVAGYVGVIDERLDLDLIAGLAAELPDWDVEIVGPVVKIDPAVLPQAPNVRYPGQQPYERLPEVMAGFDVALMPFALNEATRSISPTKTLEYLAAGLPVVSTRVPDVVTSFASFVAVRDDAAGFAEACRALQPGSSPEGDARVSALLKLHHWDTIAARMSEVLEQAAERLPAAQRPPARHQRAPRPGAGHRGFDYLVVGAGFAGAVVAERLASQAGARVLVVEKRDHIGGNAYDEHDHAGVLIHRYGPHIFHTNSREVFDHLSQFTAWRPYEHRVRASVDGQLFPIPINLDTINQLYGTRLSSRELEAFFASVAEPIAHCRTSEDVVVSKVGRELYEKFFRNYTRKQWGIDPADLDASVTARVPIRVNRDDRYFTDRYQAMPAAGYTQLFRRMLSHRNIHVLLKTDYRDVDGLVPYDRTIYTGPIDEYFGYRYGKLPYRSLGFRFETYDHPVHQPAAVVNYPNEHAYTRVTEFKQLTGQVHPKTTVVYEYPTDDGDPYYPVPQPANAELYKRYKALADATPGVHFVGRLATYKYYNMDQVVAQALQLARRLTSAGSDRWPCAPDRETASLQAAVEA